MNCSHTKCATHKRKPRSSGLLSIAQTIGDLLGIIAALLFLSSFIVNANLKANYSIHHPESRSTVLHSTKHRINRSSSAGALPQHHDNCEQNRYLWKYKPNKVYLDISEDKWYAYESGEDLEAAKERKEREEEEEYQKWRAEWKARRIAREYEATMELSTRMTEVWWDSSWVGGIFVFRSEDGEERVERCAKMETAGWVCKRVPRALIGRTGLEKRIQVTDVIVSGSLELKLNG